MTTIRENQSIVYTLGNKKLSLEPLRGLIIQDDLITLKIDKDGFDNGIQNLAFMDLYKGVSKTNSIKFTTSTDELLNVNKRILIDDDTNPNINTSVENTQIQIIDNTTNVRSTLNNTGLGIVDNNLSTSITPANLTLNNTDNNISVVMTNQSFTINYAIDTYSQLADGIFRISDAFGLISTTEYSKDTLSFNNRIA